MSYHISPQDQFELLSRFSDYSDDEISEGNFTPARPSQYNDQNQSRTLPSTPSAVPRNLTMANEELVVLLLQTLGGRYRYTPSYNTESMATVTVDEAAATAAPTGLREHLLFHLNRDYDGAVQPLTERAIAALNDNFGTGSYNGNIGDWILGGPQPSPADLMSVNVSVLRSPPTQAMTRTGSSAVGSSWTVVSMSTPTVSQVDHTADSVCAVGLQFDNVAAHPNGPGLLDEDFV
jgi:hypothetical protein